MSDQNVSSRKKAVIFAQILEIFSLKISKFLKTGQQRIYAEGRLWIISKRREFWVEDEEELSTS